MEKRKGNGITAVLIIDVLVSLVLWAILIGLKAGEVIDMHWALVLSGIVWISWILFAIDALVATIAWAAAKLKLWYRFRKVDARIIRQAKAAGVWDKPKALGGRALELKAWRDFKIKRKPGETDAALRRRCMELELTDEQRRAINETTKRIAAILQVPNGVITSNWEKESDQNQESDRKNG